MLCFVDSTSSAPWPQQAWAGVPERLGKKAGLGREQWPVEPSTGERAVESGVHGGRWEIATFSDFQSGGKPSPSAVLGNRAWETVGELFLPFPTHTPLPYQLCVLCALSHRARWEKHCINNNKIIKGMSVSEQEEGGGTGDFGSNTPSSKGSTLPSTPSSLNQMGLEVRAGGRSHRDHPT